MVGIFGSGREGIRTPKDGLTIPPTEPPVPRPYYLLLV